MATTDSKICLRVEELDPRIVPSANSFGLLSQPTEWSYSHTSAPTPVLATSGPVGVYVGIEPINPLPNLGLTPIAQMPAIDPVKEAAILKSLGTELTATINDIQALDQNSPDYQTSLGVLQLRQALLSSALQATQGIAANVLAANALLPKITALEAQIRPLLANPPTSVEGTQLLFGLISQYSGLNAQLQQLVASTQQLFQLRHDALSAVGLSDGY